MKYFYGSVKVFFIGLMVLGLPAAFNFNYCYASVEISIAIAVDEANIGHGGNVFKHHNARFSACGPLNIDLEIT